MFQLSKADDPQALPQPVGQSVTLSEKLMVPVNEYPDVCIRVDIVLAFDLTHLFKVIQIQYV